MQPVTVEVKLSGAWEQSYNDVYVLTTVDDLIAHQEIADNRVRGDFKKFMTSPAPDHEPYGVEVSSLFMSATAQSGLDILNALDRRIKESQIDKLEKIQAGRHVVVNGKGGWFDVNPEDYEIVDADPEHFMRYVNLIPCTSTLALENDDHLDPWYSTYGEELSYITNLRSLDRDQLVKAMNLAHDMGVYEVLVYTQANSLDEIKAYLSAYKTSRLAEMTVVLAVPKAERAEAVALFEKHGALVVNL